MPSDESVSPSLSPLAGGAICVEPPSVRLPKPVLRALIMLLYELYRREKRAQRIGSTTVPAAVATSTMYLRREGEVLDEIADLIGEMEQLADE